MTSSYLICRLVGIPIRAHVTLLVFLPLMAWYISGQIHLPFLFGIMSVLLFFASIALHEMGHALVAMREGCGVRQILLLPIGGIAQLSHIPAQPSAEIRIAVAGPGVSLLISLTSGLLAVLAYSIGWGSISVVFTILAGVNLVLVLFNMLPSFPMDGGRVFRAVMTPRLGRLEATRIASSIGRGMAILFGIIGLLRFDLILVAISIFIYQAAGAEYRMVRMQDIAQRFSGHPAFRTQPPLPPEDVVVGPPPYARHRNVRVARPLKRRRGLFDDLLDGEM